TEDLKVLKIGNIIQDYNTVSFKKNFQYHNSTNYLSKVVNKNDLVIALTGATVGKAGWVSEKCLLNQRVLAIKGNLEFLKYIGNFLFNNTFYSYAQIIAHGNAQGNLSPADVGNFKIPLPPKNIQEKIVKEIEVLKIKEEKINENMKILNNNISKLIDNCSLSKETKLENLSSMIKRGKSTKYGSSSIQIIKSGQARGYKKFDFADEHFVDEKFILDERQLQKGDILINSSGVGTAGRVTLFNLDGIFVVDSHVSILRVDNKKALPNFILYSLANIGFKTIEAMATGQSGQIELSLTIIKNIKINLPSIV
ncbi:MAG: restriction endonuclease subunit S, partial [Sulfurimonas sp.]|nr:restriction endonuclease subunit S [Sulfurimonas sp.]